MSSTKKTIRIACPFALWSLALFVAQIVTCPSKLLLPSSPEAKMTAPYWLVFSAEDI